MLPIGEGGVRLAVGLACLLGVVTGLPTVAAAAERQLFMFVMNQSGQPVLDIRAEEIRVEQTGSECKVVSLQPEIDGMKIALLVDTSQRAAGSLNPLRAGLRAFLERLPTEHEIGLFTIAGNTRQRVGFTTDREELAEQVAGLFAEGGGAMLLDGLIETWKRRFDEEDAWPVFVLVVHDGTEGSESVQEPEFNEFVQDLVARGGTVHSIAVSTGGGGRQTSVLLNITENTGGVYKSLLAPTALTGALLELATAMAAHYDEAKNRYRVVFECDPFNPSTPISAGTTRPGSGVRLFANRLASP